MDRETMHWAAARTGGWSVASLWVCATVMALGVAGCADSRDHETPPWSLGPYEPWLEAIIEDAREEGASENQIGLLHTALVDGEVTFEVASQGAHAAVECMQERGLDARFEIIERDSGLAFPGYVVVQREDADDMGAPSAMDECDVQEFAWLNQAYQLQPSSREIVGAYVLSRESELRSCLEDFVGPTDPTADGWDLAQQALEVLKDSQGRVNCLAHADIDSL